MCTTYPQTHTPTVFVLDGEHRPENYIDVPPAEGGQPRPAPVALRACPSGGGRCTCTPEEACKHP